MSKKGKMSKPFYYPQLDPVTTVYATGQFNKLWDIYKYFYYRGTKFFLN